MKNAATWVLLAALALPACTVNYYGVGPGGPRRGNRYYDYRDSVRTTVVTQTGTVGLPSGGGNGGYQPPVRTGGVRPNAPGTPPPPVRTPGGSPQPGYGGVRGPGRTGGPVVAAPTTPTTPTAPVKDPLYGTGGIKGPHPTTPVPTKADPVPVRYGGLGGVRPEPADEQPAQDPLAGTGGIKGPHPVIKTDPAPTGSGIGGVRDEPAAGEQPVQDPLAGTGGIKGPHPVQDVPSGPTRTGDETPGGFSAGPGKGKDEEQADRPAFVFTKGACLGPCPSYTATVWADGRVLYNGQANVPRLGTFSLRMAPATVAMLLQQAKNLYFNELPGHYASGATDIPATTLTIYQTKGRRKTVVVEDNAPDEVNALFGNVDGAVRSVADGNAENAGSRVEEK